MGIGFQVELRNRAHMFDYCTGGAGANMKIPAAHNAPVTFASLCDMDASVIKKYAGNGAAQLSDTGHDRERDLGVLAGFKESQQPAPYLCANRHLNNRCLSKHDDRSAA
jgi:hypothetical protein